MRISFDLDDTLICSQKDVPQEFNKVPWFLKPWIHEPLRFGTVDLIHTLQYYGFEIYIYTSSLRSPSLIRLWLYFYNIKNIKIINQEIYNKYLKKYPLSPTLSKNPKLFDIDFHVDDSVGVKLEGDTNGFSVILVSSEDLNWTEKILAEIRDY